MTAAELMDAGARWEDLYRLRDDGLLVELSRGVYRAADAPLTLYLDLVAVCHRAPHGTICLSSAAAFWELTDEMPDWVHLSVARGQHRPTIRYPPTKVHVFSAATFLLGRVEPSLESGETIHVSSPERTVVDLMRLRSRIGRDQALSALRRYLLRPAARPGELLALAQQLRVGRAMADALETLHA